MNIEIENQIYNLISNIINQYLAGKTLKTKHVKNIINRKDYDSYINNIKPKSIFDAKKDFNKESSLNQLIKDINNIGYKEFDNKKEYKKFIKNILTDIINDKIALEKDFKKNEGNLMDFKAFENYLLKPNKNYDERFNLEINRFLKNDFNFSKLFFNIFKTWYNSKDEILKILKEKKVFDMTDSEGISKKDFNIFLDLYLYSNYIVDIEYFNKYNGKIFKDFEEIKIINKKLYIVLEKSSESKYKEFNKWLDNYEDYFNIVKKKNNKIYINLTKALKDSVLSMYFDRIISKYSFSYGFNLNIKINPKNTQLLKFFLKSVYSEENYHYMIM